MNFKRGEQIAYIPTHAKNDLSHRDVEFGFVTSVRDGTIFCRYWCKDGKELRTVANSEATPADMLRRMDSRPQEEIERILKAIEEKPEIYGP